MHLFNKKIIKSEQAKTSVSDYSAKKIISEVPQRVHPNNSFRAEIHGESGSFRMDELLQERTGIGEKRRQEVMEKVEEGVIEKLQSVEQDAYQKAYDLGLEEGTQKGLQNAEDLVAEQLASLNQMMTELSELRQRLIVENEAQIVKLCYFLAEKIAMKNIEEDPEYIVKCVSQLIESMQSDSEVTLKVSGRDYEFIEEFRTKNIKAKEMFKNIKLFREDILGLGECIFESNHGVVNATMEERLNKLWATLNENLPKVSEETTSIERQSEVVDPIESEEGDDSE
jgi:flagellar assembly protein FliH